MKSQLEEKPISMRDLLKMLGATREDLSRLMEVSQRTVFYSSTGEHAFSRKNFPLYNQLQQWVRTANQLVLEEQSQRGVPEEKEIKKHIVNYFHSEVKLTRLRRKLQKMELLYTESIHAAAVLERIDMKDDDPEEAARLSEWVRQRQLRVSVRLERYGLDAQWKLQMQIAGKAAEQLYIAGILDTFSPGWKENVLRNAVAK